MIDTVEIGSFPDGLETERLRLVRPSLEHAEAMARLANNVRIHRVLSRLPHPYHPVNAVDFIVNFARTKSEHAYAIVTQEGSYVGIAGLHLRETAIPELGYWLGEPYWGMGYGTEAARGVVAAAKKSGALHLRARALWENQASVRVLTKAGFMATGEVVEDCGIHKGALVRHFEWRAGS